ncbi:MAG TPA: rhomboid family intramembrane serine protease [Cytophagaceae bacterium]
MSLTPMVKNLLLANVGVFFIGYLLGSDFAGMLGLRYFGAPTFQPYQFITHMFMHADLRHLFFNMLGLFMFGPLLENAWGSKKFFFFYIICGIGAAIIYSFVIYLDLHSLQSATEAYFLNPSPDLFVQFMRDHAEGFYGQNLDFINSFSRNPTNPGFIEESKGFVRSLYLAKENTTMVGASGAIFGILMGFGMLFPNTIIMPLFPPIPMKAKYFVGIYGIIELYAGVHKAEGDIVAHFAHIGGMIFAFILIKIWKNERQDFY